jgi:hypothetical protein
MKKKLGGFRALVVQLGLTSRLIPVARELHGVVRLI